MKLVVVLAYGAALATSVRAADYPSRPIRLIVPFASGSATDTSARIYAHELSAQLGQQVVPDDRPGAGGALGMQSLVRAAPDGYTIAYAGAGPLAVNRSITPVQTVTRMLQNARGVTESLRPTTRPLFCMNSCVTRLWRRPAITRNAGSSALRIAQFRYCRTCRAGARPSTRTITTCMSPSDALQKT